jgi:hypothetical protein
MPDDQARESRASAAECLRLATTATSPGSRASLVLLAQKLIERANRRAARSPGPDALLPERHRDTP